MINRSALAVVVGAFALCGLHTERRQRLWDYDNTNDRSAGG